MEMMLLHTVSLILCFTVFTNLKYKGFFIILGAIGWG